MRPAPARWGAEATLGWGERRVDSGLSPGVGGGASAPTGVHLLIPRTRNYVCHMTRQGEMKAAVESGLKWGGCFGSSPNNYLNSHPRPLFSCFAAAEPEACLPPLPVTAVSVLAVCAQVGPIQSQKKRGQKIGRKGYLGEMWNDFADFEKDETTR